MMYKTVSLIDSFEHNVPPDNRDTYQQIVKDNKLYANSVLFLFIKNYEVNGDDGFFSYLATFLIENAHSFLFNLFKMNEENTWQHNKELKNAVMPKVEQYISSKVEFPYSYKLVLLMVKQK